MKEKIFVHPLTGKKVKATGYKELGNGFYTAEYIEEIE